MRQKPIIISAFPGTGKTHFFQNHLQGSILDSDSSGWDKSLFPGNYVDYIEGRLNQSSLLFLLVSSHKSVRERLAEKEIPFHLVYPHISLKQEYLARYEARGSSDKFIESMRSHWDD